MSAACSRCSELQTAYDDFQSQSKEFEAELEHEVAAANQQIDATKAKLEKATTALAAERESGRASLLSLTAQVTALQTELSKGGSASDNLKTARRVLEQEKTDLETRLRRTEAALQDALEKVDERSEKLVMANLEVEEMHIRVAETEQRTRAQIKEANEGFAHRDVADTAALQAEIDLINEEKLALNQDISEVTTDLERMQEENEVLTKQVEQLQAQLAAGGSAAPSAAPQSLSADLAQIAVLTSKLSATESALAGAEALTAATTADAAQKNADAAQKQAAAAKQLRLAQDALALAQSDAATALAAKQAELDAAKARLAIPSGKSASDHASAVTSAHEQELTLRVASLETSLKLAKAAQLTAFAAQAETEEELSQLRNQYAETEAALQAAKLETPPDYSAATSHSASSGSAAFITSLKKERASLLSQVSDLSTQAAAHAEQFVAWELEKQALHHQMQLKHQELEEVKSTVVRLTIDSAQSPNPENSPSFHGLSSPSPSSYFSLASPSAERTEVTELQSQLQRDIDTLRGELTKSDATASVSLQPLETLQSDIAHSVQLMTSLQANLANSTDRELDLISKLSQLKGGNIRVFARVRPILAHEKLEEREENLLQYPNEQQVSIRSDAARRAAAADKDEPESASSPSAGSQSLASYTPYTFDRVFQPGTTQEEVYESVQEMILPVLNGFRTCIFAYGQTGSGKTHTMQGSDAASSPSDVGIIFRSLQTLFRGIANRGSSHQYECRLTLLECYNEKWLDLLHGATVGGAVSEQDEAVAGGDDDDAASAASSVDDEPASANKPKLTVRKGVNGMYVDGASRRMVSNVTEVLALLQYGTKQRHTEATALNEASSRSHLVMMCDVVGVNQATQVTSYGRLCLVDLAGSERVKNSGVTGARLAEAAAINKSLSALGDVFLALTDAKAKHVPFRNSPLTFLLQDCFQGNSKTLMFVNLSPSAMHGGETECSLKFATRARQVKLNQSSGANVDGFGAKYKKMLETAQTSFAAREKTYMMQLKEMKALVKTRDQAAETMQAQIKSLDARMAEADRRFERSEAERLRTIALLKPGSPNPKDRQSEQEADRKWATLQQQLQAQQLAALEAKQSLEKAHNDWKDKFASQEEKYKVAVDRLRAARADHSTGRKVSMADDDEKEDSAEVKSLTRQVALLELEVQRLKLSSRAASMKMKSPRIRGSMRGESISAQHGGISEETFRAPDENGSSEAASASASTSASAATSRAPSPPVPSTPPRPSLMSPLRPLSSSIPSFTPIGSGTSGALLAAKQAALQAQKRAQVAQSKSAAAAAAAVASESALDTSRLKPRPKRQSMLPGPKPSLISAKHSRTNSRESLPPTIAALKVRTSRSGSISGQGSASSPAPSNDGSEASESASDDGSGRAGKPRVRRPSATGSSSSVAAYIASKPGPYAQTTGLKKPATASGIGAGSRPATATAAAKKPSGMVAPSATGEAADKPKSMLRAPSSTAGKK